MGLTFKRGKRKIIADRTSKDIYRFYKEKYGEKSLSYKQFWSIWKRFIDVRLQMVVYENMELYMPHRMGSLRIKLGKDAIKLKSDGSLKYVTDWGKTKKMWQEQYPDKTSEEIAALPNKEYVFAMNETTDGRLVHWYWDRRTINFKNKSAYRIQMTRKWKRTLSKKVQNTKKIEYYE